MSNLTLKEQLDAAFDGAAPNFGSMPKDALDTANKHIRVARNGTPIWPDIGLPTKPILSSKAKAAIELARQIKEGKELVEVLGGVGAVDG